MPEAFQVPEVLGHHDAETLQRGRLRPNRAAEYPGVAVQRDLPHVVDRRERPDDEDETESQAHGFDTEALQPVDQRGGDAPVRGRGRHSPAGTPIGSGRAHSWPSDGRNRRIRMITSGISTGNADITAATPSRGSASVNA